MERTLISFNFPNIVTITVMAALGYVILGVISQLLIRRNGTQAGITSIATGGSLPMGYGA